MCANLTWDAESTYTGHIFCKILYCKILNILKYYIIVKYQIFNLQLQNIFFCLLPPLLVLLTSHNSGMDNLKLTGQPSSAGLQLVHHFVLLFTCLSVFANKVCLGLLNIACVPIASMAWTSCQHFCLSILT